MKNSRGTASVSPAKSPTTIEALLSWTFGAEKAQLDASGGLGAMTGWSGVDSITKCHRVALQGGFVDGTPGSIWVDQTASDAEIVAAEVSRLPRGTAGLIRGHAIAGTRPDYRPGATPYFLPARMKDGMLRPSASETPPRGATVKSTHVPPEERRGPRRRAERVPQWCLIVEINPPALIEGYRAEYQRWWDALDHVRWNLPPLQRWDLIDFMPDREPWRAPVASASEQRIS